ncbi:MAG TPA: prephenate dehydratase [Candidatus Binataceae bacterium]|nr:prephenate dehydratase [Candidatus Binataceae bacterium]
MASAGKSESGAAAPRKSTVRASGKVRGTYAGKLTIDDLRGRIDEINRKLVKLLSDRAKAAHQIGLLKQVDGTPVYQPARERQVIERVLSYNEGPLTPEHLRRIFTEIISACASLEQPIRVGYLGPEYSYSHEAAISRFGSSAKLMPEPSFAAIFQALENERADYGLVPVENSTEGAVNLTLDRLIDTTAVIIGEVLLPIRHVLMARADTVSFTRILSHQQSLAQCRTYLATEYPHCELEAVASNSLAAKMAADDAAAAAIGPAAAARAYGLRILAENIQDLAHNTTRFLILGREAVASSGSDKTSLLFALPERAGALHGALSLFARQHINLTMIQSRPHRESAWEYVFFVDLEGHRSDPKVARALAALERRALFLKVLGSYPEGRLAGA